MLEKWLHRPKERPESSLGEATWGDAACFPGPPLPPCINTQPKAPGRRGEGAPQVPPPGPHSRTLGGGGGRKEAALVNDGVEAEA